MARITGKTGLNGVRAKSFKTDQEKDAQRLSQVENFLFSQALKKKGTVDSARITAAKAIYDKLRPSLSAVEQHNLNEADLVSQDQIVSALEAIVAQRPQLVDHLIQIRERQRQAEANQSASSTTKQ